MSSKKSPTDIARELKAGLAASGRGSRRMRSHTFWRMFGVARRTPASTERVASALAAEGLVASVTIDALGSEGRLAWISVALADPARPAAPTHVAFDAVEALQPFVVDGATEARSEPAAPSITQAPLPSSFQGPPPRTTTGAAASARSGWAGVAAFVKDHPIAFVVVLISLCGTVSGGWVGAFLAMAFLVWAARNDLFGSRGFATRHPIASTLMLFGASVLILDHRLEVLVGVACVGWVVRAGLQRAPWLTAELPSADTALDWAGGHRIGVAVTSVVALLTLSAIGAMIGGQKPATNRSARSTSVAPPALPTFAPHIVGIGAEATPSNDSGATHTSEPTATVEAAPSTEPPTATSPPPTPTRTPKPVPPTPRPPIDIDPNRDQHCDSFPNYETMKAWRDYWQARGVANPGRLDGDGDGLACEAGEGGRPAPTRRPATPRPAPVPLYQAPAPAPPSGGGGGGGGGGCCKHCNPARSKPCGDSCISLTKTCHKGAGCACSGGG